MADVQSERGQPPLSEAEIEHDRARFYASRIVLLAEQAAQPFDKASEGLLARLPDALRTEIRGMLRMTPARDDQMNPAAFADASREMVLRSVLDAVLARDAAGLGTSAVADLGTPETVAAIEARIMPDGSGWGPIRAGMILADLRKLVIFQHGRCHPLVGERQLYLSKQPKRDVDDRVLPPENYLRGAFAIAAFAKIMRAGGLTHADSLGRDAAMLALNSKAHARRRELYNADVRDVRRRVVGDKMVLSIALRMTKTGRDRFVIISDERAIDTIIPLLDVEGDAPLFRTNGGGRLGYAAVGVALERAGELAVGKRGGATIMRRSPNIWTDGCKKEIGPLLGHTGEQTSREHYTPKQSKLAVQLIQGVNAKSAVQAAILKKSSY